MCILEVLWYHNFCFVPGVSFPVIFGSACGSEVVCRAVTEDHPCPEIGDKTGNPIGNHDNSYIAIPLQLSFSI